MHFCDAHLHLSDISAAPLLPGSRVCTSVHSPEDYAVTAARIAAAGIAVSANPATGTIDTCIAETANHTPGSAAAVNHTADGGIILVSAGIHPQNPDATLLPFLEQLLSGSYSGQKLSAAGESVRTAGQKRSAAGESVRTAGAAVPDSSGMPGTGLPSGRGAEHCLAVAAIGECGFDAYTPELALQLEAQEYVWQAQLRLADEYRKPLVVHCRRALHLLFRDAPLLKKLPSVVFHSFPGSPQEARSFLSRGINAYFSFGKQLLNGNKRAIRCLSPDGVPADRLLAETDAPYQRLKNECATDPADIRRVYEAMAALRRTDPGTLSETLCANFNNAYML